MDLGFSQDDLQKVLESMDENDFPMYSTDFADEVSEAGAPREMVSFYETLGDDVQIDSKDTALNLCEQAADDRNAVT